MTDDRTLYVGTDHALYRARPDGEGRWRAEGVALAGLGGVRGLVIDPGDPHRWWACTATSGVLVTTDGGIAWKEANEGITRLRGWCLSRDPVSGELWYGAEPVALYRSQDGGASWSPCEGIEVPPDALASNAPRPPDPSHVRDIALGSPGVVMAAVEEGWLLRSEDGGETWAGVREGVGRDCHSVRFLSGEGGSVLVTTGGGVYRSEDGGRTFAPSDDGLRHRSVTDVVVHARRPEVLYTAAAECDPWLSVQRIEGANTGFYRSDDSGHTWWRVRGTPEVLRPAPTCTAGDDGDGDSFYVGTTDGSVWLSEDGGESFRIIVEGIQGWVRHLLLLRGR